ncbi:hypothetical protein H2199_000082 [Coniosporium tulheliwenetii]|uniref:Uncharacterized protein n=1 Tax=Coniosporium tulheliwenetii TaxID=3383036 RepID=A0ACC2ZNW2_9PEZI|nr:hypothetical protein H2199_000082 [Cladosporium sp. JES 115]
MASINVSPQAWSDPDCSQEQQHFDRWATADKQSLFYMFNTLPSPSPQPERIRDKYSRLAVEELLDSASWVPGLKTALYPYQARSAALMVQRETAPELQLDPRLELRHAPDGQPFYYGARAGLFLKNPRYYEANKGGILAETMGLGKTLICLAVILATKGHFPHIPPQYQQGTTTREAMTRCVSELEAAKARYSIPVRPPRSQRRRNSLPAPRQITMCSGTILVVPQNLVHQWKAEIRKHVVDGYLRVLFAVHPTTELPSVAELSTYDLIIFSRSRFEREIRDGSDKQGRRAHKGRQLGCNCPYIGSSRTVDCYCFREESVYDSPLKKLHWLRIIIDEGHNFSSASSHAVTVADKLVIADRRWVVSGTPAKDQLLGVEVDLAVHDDGADYEVRQTREMMLEQRKEFSILEDSSGAISSLGSLATNFLKVQPWAKSDREERIHWEDYIYRHEHPTRRTFSGFSLCLRRALEQLVVKSRFADVEKDITLPPLHHRVVLLEPSFYDKLTANLFIQVLRANAVTSERTDTDYLFHPNSRKARYQLITNLRQSNFTWTGFSEEDVQKTLKVSEEYLLKDDTSCTEKDRQLLEESIALAKVAAESPGWKALSWAHELLKAQALVDSQLSATDPTAGLEAAGNAARAEIDEVEEWTAEVKKKKSNDIMTSKSVPSSCVLEEVAASKRRPVSTPGKTSPKKEASMARAPDAGDGASPALPTASPKKRMVQEETDHELSEDSPLKQPRIIGTTSSKLSYLLEQIRLHHEQEKILIFYDSDNNAYYIAQCLELLHIKHRIYAKSLKNELRSQYVVAFREDPTMRVMLLDIRCGALGLDINSASRIYFINPCNRPSVEAQAIKRAHRIGQTRPVYVETLVAKGTVEEAIFERAKAMTRTEHQETKTLEDDQKIKDIVMEAQAIPVDPAEAFGERQMARLHTPLQVFGRPGRSQARIDSVDTQSNGDKTLESPAKRQRTVKPKPKKAKPASTKGKLVPALGDVVRVATPVAAEGEPSLSLFGGPANP